MPAGFQLTRTAEDDLREILQFIARRDGTERALHVHARFFGAFEAMAAMPSAGRKRPGLTGEQVRWWRVFRWLVIYEPASRPVTILRVIHGARIVDDLFGHAE